MDEFNEEVPKALREFHSRLVGTGFTDEQAFTLVQTYFVVCLRQGEPKGYWGRFDLEDEEDDDDDF